MRVHTPLFLLGMIAAACAGATDRDDYNLRGATEDLAIFHEHARDGVLYREAVLADLNFGPRFDDADVNRDGQVTAGEMSAYLEQAYGVRASSSTGAGSRP